MLWTAPEILIESNKASGAFVPRTQKGDVYSFAIICQEMLYRNGTFFVSEENQPPPAGLIYFIVRFLVFFLALGSPFMSVYCLKTDIIIEYTCFFSNLC